MEAPRWPDEGGEGLSATIASAGLQLLGQSNREASLAISSTWANADCTLQATSARFDSEWFISTTSEPPLLHPRSPPCPRRCRGANRLTESDLALAPPGRQGGGIDSLPFSGLPPFWDRAVPVLRVWSKQERETRRIRPLLGRPRHVAERDYGQARPLFLQPLDGEEGPLNHGSTRP